MRILCAALALGLALASGGCATIARGTGEQVAFDTVPSGAEVQAVIDNAYKPPEGDPTPRPADMACVTPCVLQVKRHDKLMITVTKVGFERETFALVPTASAEGVATSVAGNLLLAGGVLGVIVDGASGSGLDKCPNPVRMTLRPLQQPARRGGPPPAPSGFGYDPVAACKELSAAKNAQAEQVRAAQPEIR